MLSGISITCFTASYAIALALEVISVTRRLAWHRWLIVAITVAGGLFGALGAWALGRFGGIALSSDGITLSMDASPFTLLVGLAVSAAIGVFAGLLPAWQAARREIAACFRAV